MCGGCAPATGINSPPEGGEQTPRAGRFASLAQPYAPRLGRSRTGGATPPRPPRAAPPVRPSAHGSRLCADQEGGASAARRPKAGGLFRGNFFKKAPQGREAGRGLGGRAPPGREAVGNPAQAVGGQGAAAGCARRPRTGRGCPRTTGPQGAAVEAVLAAPHSAYYVQSEKQRAAKPRQC